jgi:hypothetical protein
MAFMSGPGGEFALRIDPGRYRIWAGGAVEKERAVSVIVEEGHATPVLLVLGEDAPSSS